MITTVYKPFSFPVNLPNKTYTANFEFDKNIVAVKGMNHEVQQLPDFSLKTQSFFVSVGGHARLLRASGKIRPGNWG